MLLFRCRFRMVGKEQIHPGQMGIVITLAQQGGCNQRALAKALRCSAATIAVSVKRLEKSGYVKKAADPDDLRSTRILLTERGEELAERSLRCAEQVATMQLQGFAPEELAQLLSFQHRIRKNMEDYLKKNSEERDDLSEKATGEKGECIS